MIHFGVLLAQGTDLTIPVPPPALAAAMMSVVLTFLLAATMYLMKRSLDTLREIEGRVNRHDTTISMHDIRIGSLEERVRP